MRFYVAVATATLVVAACSSSANLPPESLGTTTTTSPPTTTTTSPPTTTTTSPAPEAHRIEIEIRNETVIGEDRFVVERGRQIEIVVLSDIRDEIHVHGYDYKVEVAPSIPAVMSFVADLPGIYEVELEKAHLLLFELEVR